MRYSSLVSMCVLACFVSTVSLASESRPAHPQIQAVRTDTPPSIDGHFDESEWKNATVLDGFKQVIPTEGAEPSQKTVVYLTYDSDNLYLAIRCFDKNPEQIIAKQMQKEVDYSSDDIVEVVIDPFGDKRNGYYFSVSAAGGKIDGLVEQGNTINTLWDTLWTAKVTTDETGWTAEIAIPC